MRKIIFILLSAVLSLTACKTIHEYPGEPGVDPSLIDVKLSLDIDMELNDGDPIIQTYMDMLGSAYDIRYIVEIYKVSDSYAETVGSLQKRIVKTEETIIEDGVYSIDEQIQLHAGVYSVMVWIDFVIKGTDTDYYYNTANLHEIRINRIDGAYPGYDVTKDAFSAQENLDLIPYANERFAEIEMTIPAHTEAAYGLYFPMGYNVYYSVPDAFEAGVGYTFDVVETVEQKEAILASDYVFVDDKETFYYLNFSVYSAEDKLINTSRDIRINLERNRLTIVRGEFLTRDIDDGEIGIDPGFDEEIVVPIG